MNGCFGARINTQGNYNAKIGKFVRSGSTKGLAGKIMKYVEYKGSGKITANTNFENE